MKSVTLKIKGMHCSGCAQNIKALVSSDVGVRGADVSFKGGQVRILFDPQTAKDRSAYRGDQEGRLSSSG
ncbi:MAG: heavy-metal-associated domain-containing protein [Novosphingobium sp.]